MANTVWNGSDKSVGITLTGSNLIATNNNGSASGVRAVDRQVTGKFYWECTLNVVVSNSTAVGIVSPYDALTASPSNAGIHTSGVIKNGATYVDGVSVSKNIGALTNGSVVCIAVDCTARLVWYRLGAAGLWNGAAGADPATGTGGTSITHGVGIPIYPGAWPFNLNDQITANFGDTAFTGAVPSGFTSGFTAGTSVPTNALATTAFAEHWLTTNPDAQTTSVVVEHWQSVSTTGLQAVATTVLVEHWMSVAVVVPAAGGPMVTMIH